MRGTDVEIKFSPLAGSWIGKTTPASARKRPGVFKVDWSKNMKALRAELAHLKPVGPVHLQIDMLASDMRQDGMPRADARRPKFPGVRITVNSNHLGTLSYQCDKCEGWEDNIRAISLTLERLRLVSLYDVASDNQQYKGWKALPAPEHAAIATISAAADFISQFATGHKGADRILKDGEHAKRAYREAAAVLHADTGTAHTPERWQMLMASWGLIEQMHKAAGRL